MAKKIEFTKAILSSGVKTLEVYYPRTTADNVLYELANGTTSDVQTVLSALIQKVDTMYEKLYFESVYMTDSNGTVLNDGSGYNLVAVY